MSVEHANQAGPRGYSTAKAVAGLGDTALVLFAAREAAKLFWSIILRRFPELR